MLPQGLVTIDWWRLEYNFFQSSWLLSVLSISLLLVLLQGCICFVCILYFSGVVFFCPAPPQSPPPTGRWTPCPGNLTICSPTGSWEGFGICDTLSVFLADQVCRLSTLSVFPVKPKCSFKKISYSKSINADFKWCCFMGISMLWVVFGMWEDTCWCICRFVLWECAKLAKKAVKRGEMTRNSDFESTDKTQLVFCHTPIFFCRGYLLYIYFIFYYYIVTN